MMTKIKLCKVCGKGFDPPSPLRAICSYECQMEKNRTNRRKYRANYNGKRRVYAIENKELRAKWGEELYKKQGCVCNICKKPINWWGTIDHIIPRNWFARHKQYADKVNIKANLQIVCINCNIKKGSTCKKDDLRKILGIYK